MSDAIATRSLADVIRRALPLLTALLLVLVAYAHTLGAQFLWDDRPLLEAPAVRELMAPWRYLTTSFWGSSEHLTTPLFYRPVVTFSLALDRAFHGDNPVGFHLTNLVLHLVNTGLIYALGRKYGASPIPAATAATLWALLPRLTESVAWISGRTDMLCMLFISLAWLAYRPGDLKRILVASALAFLALLSKEAGIAVVLALCISEVLTSKSLRGLLRLLPLGILTAVYIWLRSLTLGGTRAGTIALTTTERLLTIAEAIGRYAFMVLNPWQPESQMGVLKVPALGFVALGVLVLAGVVVLAWWLRKNTKLAAMRSPHMIFGATLALVPLLLVIHLIPMPWLAVVGDRLLYIPLGAAAVLLGRGLGHPVFARRAMIATLAAIALSFAWTTRNTAALYTNSVEFWVRAVETTPRENWGPSIELSSEYFRAGLFEQSLLLAQSIEQRADPTGVQRTLNDTHVAALANLGRYDDALRLAEGFADHRARAHEIQLIIARLRMNRGDLREADALARDLQIRFPTFEPAQELVAQVERVSHELVNLRASTETGFAKDLRAARLATNLGQGPRAAEAWLGILAHPEASEDALEEAMGNLIAFASHDAMIRGGELYTARSKRSSALLWAFDERSQKARELKRLNPRVERALGLDLSAPLR